MKQGSSRVGRLVRAALSGLIVLGGLSEASPASAQKPTPGHAKPKSKKPKPAGKSPHHGASGGAKSGGKTHASHGAKASGAGNGGASGAGNGGAGSARGGAAGGAGGAGSGVGSGARAAAKSESVEIHLPIQRVTLENGLRVVMSVDRTSPAVAVSVAYDVGARDEAQGQSGLARIVERMMFQGSANVAKGDHARLVASRGGQSAGESGAEMSVYSEALPASELALGLWLEADRMKSLDWSAEGFESQRRATQEEARARLGSAYGPAEDRAGELVYQGAWPYEHPAAGSPDDLGRATLEQAKALHAGHYGPNNAALVIAGDFDPDEAMGLVHKHFDAIPRIAVAARQESALPEQTAQRTAVVRSERARTPEVRYGWAIPPSRDADRDAVELAAFVIAEGESSRLYQVLVRDKAVAEDVSAVVTPMSRGPGSLSIVARLSSGAKVGDVEKLIEAELSRLGKAAPSEAEMQKAKRRAQATFVLDGLSTIAARADRLAAYEVLLGSALAVNEELSQIGAATGEDVRRVAAQYLGPTRRTIVETYPAGFDIAKTSQPASRPQPAAAHAARAESSAAGGATALKTEPKKAVGHEKHDAKKAAKSGASKAKKSGVAKGSEGAKKKGSGAKAKKS